jgi:hypothetical protein
VQCLSLRVAPQLEDALLYGPSQKSLIYRMHALTPPVVRNSVLLHRTVQDSVERACR